MDVRRQVLDAAIEVCASEGPDAVSMRDVARRAGVSHQAPYHYFHDRAGIFAVIAEEGFDHLTHAMDLALDESRSPAAACFDAYLRIAREYPGHFRVMFRRDICGISAHEPTRESADSAYNALERMVDRILERPVDADEKAVWASLMWSLAHGFAALLSDGPLAAKLPDGTDIEKHIADFNRLVTKMVENQARLVSEKSSR